MESTELVSMVFVLAKIAFLEIIVKLKICVVMSIVEQTVVVSTESVSVRGVILENFVNLKINVVMSTVTEIGKLRRFFELLLAYVCLCVVSQRRNFILNSLFSWHVQQRNLSMQPMRLRPIL